MSQPQSPLLAFQPRPVCIDIADDTEFIVVDDPETWKRPQREQPDSEAPILSESDCTTTHSDSGYCSESPTSVAQSQPPSYTVQERETKVYPVSVSRIPGFSYALKDSYLAPPTFLVDAGAENTRRRFELQDQCYSQSPLLPTLLKLSKKRYPKPDSTKRRIHHVRMANLTRPVEYFRTRTELKWVFRSYFKTILELRDNGMEHRNIGLENLAIAPRGKLVGKGIITSYDDIRDPSRQIVPRFIYTMPSRNMIKDRINDPIRHNSLESLLLCLIWIVTTRSGPNNEKRMERSSYSFSDTELCKWHRNYGDYHVVCNLSKRRRSTMSDSSLFERKVLRSIDPHFDKLKDFMRAFRALVYGPQWRETRDAIGFPDLVPYNERRFLVDTYRAVIEDASASDPTALERALEGPARTDKNIKLGKYACTTVAPYEVIRLTIDGLNEERMEEVKKLLGIADPIPEDSRNV